MKTLSIYFVAVLFLIQTQAFGDDKKIIEESGISDISIEYFDNDFSLEEDLFEVKSLVIYDNAGNILREAEIVGEFNEYNSGIFKTLITKSNFLTEINGVMYYIKKN